MSSKLSSKFSGLFIKIFLIISWALLLLTLALAILMTIYPNILGNGTFGVWATQNTTNFSTLGYVLLIGGSVSIVFSFIIQAIAKSRKFTIGKSNRVISYFSTIMFPTIIMSVMAFVGTLTINGLVVPGAPSTANLNTLLFYQLNLNSTTFPWQFMTTSTWVWLIMVIFTGISAISVAFTTIKFLFRILFNGTHDKVNV